MIRVSENSNKNNSKPGIAREQGKCKKYQKYSTDLWDHRENLQNKLYTMHNLLLGLTKPLI